MKIPRLLLAIALLPALAACSSDTTSVETLRGVASAADDPPTRCPYDLDVSDAVGGDATAGEVDVEVSESRDPLDLGEEVPDGVSAVEAAAASYVSCDYDLEDGSITVYVTTSPIDGTAASNLLLPLLQADAGLSSDQVDEYADNVDDEVVVTPGGEAALALVPVGDGDGESDGSAALMITGGGITGDRLADAVEKLQDDLLDEE